MLCWHWICGKEIKASRVYVACVWETENGNMRSTTPILQSTVHRRDNFLDKDKVFHENNPGADGLSPGV